MRIRKQAPCLIIIKITQQILSDVTNDEQYTNLSFEVEINKHLQQFGNEDDQEKNGNYN